MTTIERDELIELSGGVDWLDFSCGFMAFMTVAAFIADPSKSGGAYLLAKAAPLCAVALLS